MKFNMDCRQCFDLLFDDFHAQITAHSEDDVTKPTQKKLYQRHGKVIEKA